MRQIFNVDTARIYGLVEAVLLYVLNEASQNGFNEININELQEIMPYLTKNTIYNKLRKLEKIKLIKSTSPNIKNMDKTKYYTIL
jgi:DNA-binding PadR family transcriptional regulator